MPNWAANVSVRADPPLPHLAADAVVVTMGNAVEPPVANGLMGNALSGSAVQLQAPHAEGDSSHTLADLCGDALVVRRGLERLYSELPAS